MAMTFTAPFAQTPKTAYAACSSAGTIADDSPTNTALLVTAGSNGCIVTRVSAIPRGTVTATGIYLFISKDSGTTKRLKFSETMSAQTLAATAGVTKTNFADISESTPLRLEAADRLYCSIGVALTNGAVFSAEFVDF